MGHLILALFLFFTSYSYAGSWAGQYESVVISDKFYVSYEWGIMPPHNVPGTVQCSAAMCHFGPLLRAGVGKSSSGYYCDGGGICNGNYTGLSEYMIKVPNGTSYTDAYDKYVAKFGLSGRVIRTEIGKYYPDEIAWGKLCTGFAILPVDKAVISTLVPDTSCGLVAPPQTSCEIILPQVLDLGTPLVGATPPSVSHAGRADCVGHATISAAIMNTPELDGNVVTISINNKVLSSKPQTVGVGSVIALNTTASVSAPFLHAGYYETNAILLMSYY
ncbi:hypothetical protein [Serratia plymuthica]|uniref:hypothetical protein n=1 Tax=Serratia plymuthica TaxID=82996 RepID=UPI0011C48DE2|nr:hypothetical protein [Serratia plymuthica]